MSEISKQFEAAEDALHAAWEKSASASAEADIAETALAKAKAEVAGLTAALHDAGGPAFDDIVQRRYQASAKVEVLEPRAKKARAHACAIAAEELPLSRTATKAKIAVLIEQAREADADATRFIVEEVIPQVLARWRGVQGLIAEANRLEWDLLPNDRQMMHRFSARGTAWGGLPQDLSPLGAADKIVRDMGTNERLAKVSVSNKTLQQVWQEEDLLAAAAAKAATVPTQEDLAELRGRDEAQFSMGRGR